MQHTFSYISLPLFCTATMWNFKKLPGYSFTEEMSHVFLFIFFHCHSFSRTLVATSISYFPTTATKFSSCSSNKKMSLLSSISHSFSCWALLACCLLSLYSKFVDMTIILIDNTDTETISAFRFRKLLTLLSCLCFTRCRWLCDFPPNLK